MKKLKKKNEKEMKKNRMNRKIIKENVNEENDADEKL